LIRGAAVDERLTVFGSNGSGGHSVGVRVGGLAVLVSSSGPEQDEPARELAAAILAAAEERRAHTAEMERAEDIIRTLRAERAAAREALRCAVEGRRAFFGPVLCVPVVAGDWTGPVWLLDPEKRHDGHGLRFESLLELRALHPELWIVDVTERGVLLDAVKLPGVKP
jgi:hypothetical protein